MVLFSREKSEFNSKKQPHCYDKFQKCRCKMITSHKLDQDNVWFGIYFNTIGFRDVSVPTYIGCMYKLPEYYLYK